MSQDLPGPTGGDLQELLYKDELTGIFNRRFYSTRYPEEAHKAQQAGTPLSIAVVDVDYFKTINDTYGHHEGDRLLARMGAIMKETCTEPAVPIRYGGDEFIILMPGMPRSQGVTLLEKLSENIRNTPFELEDGRPLKMTLSVGVAGFPEDNREAAKIFDAADGAVYISKKGGRNRVSTPDMKARVLFDAKNFHRLFPCPKLIGRNDVMAEIKPHLAPQANVARPIIVLEGVSGIGKSRILEECRAAIDTQRSALLHARGQPYLVNQPFGVFVEALRYQIRSDRRLAEAAAAPLSPQERRVLSPLLPEIGMAGLLSESLEEDVAVESPRKVTVDALIKVLLGVAEGKQLTIIVDDLHWCDAGALEVLERLKGCSEGKTVLVLAALVRRDEAKKHGDDSRAVEQFLIGAMKRKLSDTGNERLVKPIEVGFLNLHLVREMLTALIAGLEKHADLVTTVTNKSQGRPLLVEEIVKFLIQREYITSEAEAIKVLPFSEDDLPANLEELLELRTLHLDQEVRSFMTKAAVLGGTFDLDGLKALEEAELGERAPSEGELLDVIEEGVRSAIIQPEGGDQFRFMSQGAQQALYQQLEETMREALHARVADFEEQRASGQTDAAMGRLAYHHQAAGELDRAREILNGLEAFEQQPVAFPGRPVIMVARSPRASAKDWGKEETLSSEDMQAAIALARDLRSSIQNYRLFPANSELLRGIQEQVLAKVEGLLQNTETLTFGAAEGTLLINGQVPLLKSKAKPARIDFLTFLEETGLRGISFKRGITLDEVRVFLGLMCLKPEVIHERGGWSSLMEAESIEHILVNEKVYVAVGERDIVYKTEGPIGSNVLIKDITGMEEGGPAMQDAEIPRRMGAGASAPDMQDLMRRMQEENAAASSRGRGLEMQHLREHFDRMAELFEKIPQQVGGNGQSEEGPGTLSPDMEHFARLQQEILQSFKRMPRGAVPVFIQEISEEVDVLCKDLESGNNLKIALATDTLIEQGNKTVDPLVHFIMTTDDLRARRVALHCLHRVTSSVLDRLLGELHRTQHHEEKRRLIATLGEYQDPRVVEQLEPFVHFPEHMVRREAIRVLESMQSPYILNIMRAAMYDENEAVQQDAIASLGRMGNRAPVPDLVNKIKKRSILFFEEQTAAQREACIALGLIGDRTAVPYLIQALARSPWWTLQHTKDPLIRAAAAVALSSFPGPDAEKVLRRACHDKNPVVRSGAKVALNKLLGQASLDDADLQSTLRIKNAEIPPPKKDKSKDDAA